MKHEHVPGITASICVHGQALIELRTDDEEANAVTTAAYVEAVSNAAFSVVVQFDQKLFPYPRNDIDIAVYLDGKSIGGVVSDAGWHELSQLDGREEPINGQAFLRRFRFTDLTTNEDVPEATLKDELKHLGTISVKLTRCVVKGPIKRRDFKSKFKPIGGDTIPEKSLKGRAISSRATLDVAEKSTALLDWYKVGHPFGREPFAEFAFKYRSHKDLQVEGLIPRSPSPVPLEDRDLATLSRKEMLELLVRRNREREELVHIKREKRERFPTVIGDGDDDDDFLVTQVASRKRQRISTHSGAELIDLTGD